MSGQRTDVRRARRLGTSLITVLGMVAALLAVMVVASSPPAQAQGLPATCDPGSIFNLGQSGILYETTTPSNGAPVSTQIADFTPTGTTQTTTNALGVAADASTFYAAQMTVTSPATTMTVFRMNGATGAVQHTTVPGVAGTYVMGAVNPAPESTGGTGIYYFGVYANLAVPGMSGTPRVLRILGYNPATNQGLGEVARIVVDPSGSTTVDGDFAFDSEGNLYVLIGRRIGQGPAPNTGISTVVKVPAVKLPEQPVATPVILDTEPLARITTPGDAYFNGIAFAADGNLYAQSTLASPSLTSRIWTINPNTGAIGDPNPPNQTFIPPLETGGNPNDLAGCSFPGTVTVQKVLPDGRANPLDQFTTTITQENNANAHWDATTEGPADGPQSPSAFTIGIPDTTYHINEALDPSSSSTSPAAYDRHLPPTCHNNTTNQDVPVTGPNPDGSFSMVFPGPTGVQGAVVLCQFTNTPAAPRLTLRKDLADEGRLDDTDQFRMQVLDGDNNPVGDGNATTQGTGADVAPDTGIQTVSNASNGPFHLSEFMADGSANTLDAYQHLIQCTDLNRVQTGLPNHTFTTAEQPIQVTPQPGSDIDCVMTNSRPVPVLGLSKVFGSTRVSPDDQFRVAIVGPGGEVDPQPEHSPTTDGAGQDVTEGTGTTGFVTVTAGTTYQLTEAPVGNTNAALYTSTVTCKDQNGLTTGLPDNTPLPTSVTPAGGSWISCVITNTGIPPTFQLSKALSGPRVNPGDQWTMQILHNDTVVGTPGTATTTGSGATIDTGTGVTREDPATAGDTYLLQEVAAGSTVSGQYTQSLTCEDTNGVQDPATLPTEDSLPAEIVPQLGAAIVCVNTNTPDPPTVSITKTSTATQIVPGAHVPYTLTVTNTGTSPAAGVVVTDTLPTGLTFVSSDVVLVTSEGNLPLAGCTAAAQVVTCDLGDINRGESVQINLVTLASSPFPATDVDANGNVVNTATVTSDGSNCPPDSADPACTDDETLPVQPTLEITKTSTATQVVPGGQVPYTLTVTNTGPVPAGSVVVTDTLPTGLAFVSSTPTCTAAGQVVTCDLGSIAVSGVVTIQLVTRAANPFPPGGVNAAGQVVNVARVTSPGTNCPPSSTDPACSAQKALPVPAPPSAPRVRTRTSSRQVTPGKPFRDTIRVSGLRSGQRATAVAGLYGPFSSRGEASCTAGFQASSKTLQVSNGRNRTPKVRVRAPGVYTWRVTVLASSANLAATHACGQSAETTVVAKPAYKGPAIKGGFTGSLGSERTVAERAATTRIRMSSIGLDAAVVPERIAGTHMVLPPASKVGWLKKSDQVGDKIGSVVVGGHVSDRRDRPGALFRLKKARTGQLLTVTRGGQTYTYKVTGKVTFSRHRKIPQKYFRTTGKPRLVVVSCVHKVLLPHRRFTYTKYIIVVANQVS